MSDLVLWPGVEPRSSALGVLASGPPGKSPEVVDLISQDTVKICLMPECIEMVSAPGLSWDAAKQDNQSVLMLDANSRDLQGFSLS